MVSTAGLGRVLVLAHGSRDQYGMVFSAWLRILPLAHGSRDLYGMVSAVRSGRVLPLGVDAHGLGLVGFPLAGAGWSRRKEFLPQMNANERKCGGD